MVLDEANSSLGYMVTSSIFSAPYVGSTNKFSLCLIIKHSCINTYLILHNIIVDSMYHTPPISIPHYYTMNASKYLPHVIGMTQLVYKLKAMLDKVSPPQSPFAPPLTILVGSRGRNVKVYPRAG